MPAYPDGLQNQQMLDSTTPKEEPEIRYELRQAGLLSQVLFDVVADLETRLGDILSPELQRDGPELPPRACLTTLGADLSGHNQRLHRVVHALRGIHERVQL